MPVTDVLNIKKLPTSIALLPASLSECTLIKLKLGSYKRIFDQLGFEI